MGDEDYDDDDDDCVVCDGCICGDVNDTGSDFSGGNEDDEDYYDTVGLYDEDDNDDSDNGYVFVCF